MGPSEKAISARTQKTGDLGPESSKVTKRGLSHDPPIRVDTFQRLESFKSGTWRMNASLLGRSSDHKKVLTVRNGYCDGREWRTDLRNVRCHRRRRASETEAGRAVRFRVD